MSDINAEWKELRPKIGNFICRMDGMTARVDAKLKEVQEKEELQEEVQAQIDEAYNKGLEDARNAVLQLYRNENWREIFGSCYNFNILTDYSMAEIIEKENQLKAEKEKQAKEQDFHVGDEVTTNNGLVGIIIDADDNNNSGIVWITYRVIPEARGLDFCWVSKIDCKKTGRHFDSIPFDYNPKKR